MNVFKWYKISCEKKSIAIYVMLYFLNNVILVILPIIMGNFVNYINAGKLDLMISKSFQYMMLVIALAIISYALNIVAVNVSKKNEYRLKSYIYNKIFDKKDFDNYNSNQSAYIANRVESDSNIVINFLLNQNVSVLFSILTVIGVIFIILKLDFQITIVIIGLLCINSTTYFIFKKRIAEYSYKTKETQSVFFEQQNEMIFNTKSIKRNKWEDVFLNKLNETFSNLFKVFVKSMRVTATYSSCNLFIQNMMTVSVMIFVGYKVISGYLDIGSFFIISNYIGMLINTEQSFLTYGSNYQSANVSSNRLIELIKNSHEDCIKSDLKSIEELKRVEFKNVSFGYGDTFLKKDVNYIFEKSKIYTICGENGIGKSSFIDIMLNVSPYNGNVLYNGIDMSEINLEQILKYIISVQEQSPIIIKDTLLNNIKLGLVNVDNEKMDFLINYFNIDTNLDQVINSNLSGGEKQKINIIRCLLKKSQLLIFDEPTNSLDIESKIKFINILNQEKRNKIIIVISHDKEILDISDEIIEF